MNAGYEVRLVLCAGRAGGVWMTTLAGLARQVGGTVLGRQLRVVGEDEIAWIAVG